MKSRIVKLGAMSLAFAMTVASFGALNVQAATGTQEVGINGTVSAISTVDITVPVSSLEFTIHNDGTMATTAKKVINNTAVPVYGYITGAWETTDNAPVLSADNFLTDWTAATHEQTIANIALSVNTHNLSTVRLANPATDTIDTANYIALGGIAAKTGELDLALTANYGRKWENATDVNFTYKMSMLFTTIENNFGSTGGSGSGTLVGFPITMEASLPAGTTNVNASNYNITGMTTVTINSIDAIANSASEATIYVDYTTVETHSLGVFGCADTGVNLGGSNIPFEAGNNKILSFKVTSEQVNGWTSGMAINFTDANIMYIQNLDTIKGLMTSFS